MKVERQYQEVKSRKMQQSGQAKSIPPKVYIVDNRNKTGLPDSLKSGVENMSGISMDDVRVHYNSDKPAQMQAYAYAQGTDIHVAPGQEKHLPHEAWHVVQQKQGRVHSTMQMQGMNINNDTSLEKEADVLGKGAVMHGKGIAQSTLQMQAVSDKSILQLSPMNVQIKGITHLVKMENGSLFKDEMPFDSGEIEVSDPAKIMIDTSKSIWSRRGPNQENNREIDRMGQQIYEWYEVEQIDSNDIVSGYYLRDETFTVRKELNIERIASATHFYTVALPKKMQPKKGESKTPAEMDKLETNFISQNMGPIFEDCVDKYIRAKHPGADIYNSLAVKGLAELDFTIIQGDDVLIYSAKLNPAEFTPSKDLEHWSIIKKIWQKIRNEALNDEQIGYVRRSVGEMRDNNQIEIKNQRPIKSIQQTEEQYDTKLALYEHKQAQDQIKLNKTNELYLNTNKFIPKYNCPKNPPLIRLISPETFRMNRAGFMALIKKRYANREVE